ncbi:unnamed protein product [Clavelina lepadiformis]|uniref:MICAL-like protein 2 n=1 Tax=Clavelina lepadiformis TaxID=159417 RepID=A0ABP0FT94_CLALP
MAGKMKALQMWCKRNTEGYKDVNVVNMTTSWRDGLAFCALIHRFRPDLIDFESLSKENILHNNQLAFRTAENELGIAALLDAEDMVAMKVPDKLSIITYVSQYYNSLHKLKPADAKPLKRPSSPKQVPETVEVKRKPVEPKKVIPATNQPLAEKSQVFSTCEVCKKKVHLVERYIDEGKVYHRQCHRTKSLSGMYRRDKSTPFYQDGSWKKPHQEVASIKKPSPFASDPPKEKKSIEKPVPKCATPKLAAANLNAVSKNSRFSTPTATSSTPSSGKSSPNPEKQASKVIEMALAYAQKNEGKQKSSPTHSQGNITTAAVTNIALDATDSVFGSKSAHVVEKPAETTNDDIITNIPGRESRLTKKEEQLNPFAMDARSEGEEKNVPDSKSVIGGDSPKPTKGNDRIPQFQKSQNPKSEVEQVKADEDNAAKVPNEIHCDDETKEMLPALLKSLAGVKEKQSHEKSEAIKTDNKDVSSSDIAPLVSELPKATPLAKPRSPTGFTDDTHQKKPKPRPRSNRSSFDTKQPRDVEADVVTDSYGHDLNPFASDAMSTDSSIEQEENLSKKESYDDSLNPFGEESSESDNEDVHTLKPSDVGDKSLNPFGDEFESNDVVINNKTQGQDEERTRTRTINTVSAHDERLNPFNVEYEKKKQSTPKPPARRKAHAPAPPPPKLETPDRAVVSAPRTSPSRSKVDQNEAKLNHLSASPSNMKKKAPDWKLDVEQKMKEMNNANKTDKKYVAKTAVRNATNPKNLQSATTKSPTRKPALSSHKQLHKPSRPAPGFGFPLVKRRVKNQMTEEEIQNEMMVLDIQLKDLEKKGVKLEEVLRDEMEMGVDWKNESDQMLGEWFELVHDKNKLVRRETELVFLMQQQRLEQEHADVEFKIRKLLNKPESEKTEEEKKEEKKLLDQLVDIVERRNTIINSIEEERVKEEKEDAAYNQIMMLQRESPSDSDSTKKKKKNKVKKIFSKRKKAPKSSSAEEQCSSSQPSSR